MTHTLPFWCELFSSIYSRKKDWLFHRLGHPIDSLLLRASFNLWTNKTKAKQKKTHTKMDTLIPRSFSVGHCVLKNRMVKKVVHNTDFWSLLFKSNSRMWLEDKWNFIAPNVYDYKCQNMKNNCVQSTSSLSSILFVHCHLAIGLLYLKMQDICAQYSNKYIRMCYEYWLHHLSNRLLCTMQIEVSESSIGLKRKQLNNWICRRERSMRFHSTRIRKNNGTEQKRKTNRNVFVWVSTEQRWWRRQQTTYTAAVV